MIEIPIDQLAAPEAVEPSAEDDLRRKERLAVFGQRLDKLFQEQVADKAALEDRWLKDLRQYNGEYDDDTLQRIRMVGGSEAFVNLTRVKCNAAEARIGDMALPTEDRNWSIEPTPVPQLRQAMRDRSLARGPDGSPVMGPAGAPLAVADAVQELVRAAKDASDRMQRAMDDQLQECSYNAVIRNVIHNAVVYGTGILKGPVVRNRARTTYARQQMLGPDGTAAEQWVMRMEEDLAPAAESVSPWHFFPDMRAARIEDAEFVFERHPFNKARLRDLAKLPGFDAEQINAVLLSEPKKALSGMFEQSDSEAIRGTRSAGHYEVIEYTGPIDKGDLIAAGVQGIDLDDEITVYQGTVWFCNGVVLKAVLSLLDTGELMYDVMPLERDDTCVFGFGVPYLMRNSQRAGNAAWRMIMDNARLSVGGQVLYKTGKVRPTNGDYRVTSLKTWEVTDPNSNIADVFGVVPIVANFQGMFQIFETVRQLTDEETGLPMIAQGQQSPAVTKTAQGMSLLMNSANTVLRRIVKEFDDSVTSRFIRRLYRWNMQFGDDEQAKGDYTVVALGSSSLMVREQQVQGLMQLAQLAATNPEFAQRAKWGEILRTITKAMSINAEGLVKTEEEVQAEKQAAAQQPPQMPPEMQIEMAKLEVAKAEIEIKRATAAADQQVAQAQAQAAMQHAQASSENERRKIDADLQRAQMDAQADMARAQSELVRVQVERELALMKIAAEREMTLEQVRKEFGIKTMEIESSHQLFNAERALKLRTGQGI